MPEQEICLIDYGMGNLHSVSKALERAGGRVNITSDPAVLQKATTMVLPGVGAIGAAMLELEKRNLKQVVVEHWNSGKPFLGICLGLQLLFQESEEDGPVEGLGLLKGKVVRFQGDMKIPHMGWNQLIQRRPSRLFQGIPDKAFFYFVHSYYPELDDEEAIIGETEYGSRFTCAIEKGNCFAVQFHPEKSQETGARMLKNFVALASSV